MLPQSIPLYSVKGTKGAHFLISCRETESGDVADVQMIGALLPYSVPVSNVAPYTQADAVESGSDIFSLAQEAATLFRADPARIQRAAEIARDPYAVQQAAKDEKGNAIIKSLNVFYVKGSRGGWYVVRPGSCTCEDHKRGHTCKHRIAAWMRRENIIRSIAQARKVSPSVVLAEMVG